MTNRSGSETRQRQVQRTVRLTAAEDQVLRNLAHEAGVSVAAYIRSAALRLPPRQPALAPPPSLKEGR